MSEAVRGIKYELWLMKLEIASTIKSRLTDTLGDAKCVYEADKKLLLDTGTIDEETCDKIVSDRDRTDIDKLYEEFIPLKQQLITRSMAHFPEKLKTIPAAPYGLFYMGSLPESLNKCVSIVGARQCSEYGRSMARDIAMELARLGYIIVSGMALGIDSAAHTGALISGGITLAILGCGVDICYPRGNINMYTDILEKGAVMSEFYPGEKPIARNFPTRNRIISALSNQVIIIEARERSGSLITADFALSQGKDIYALPGRVSDTLSRGCNRLIEQGAGIITSVEGLISSIEDIRVNTLITNNTMHSFVEAEDEIIYKCLDYYPKSMDSIVSQSGLELMRALASIMNLCDMGYAREVFVNQYIKVM